MWSMCYCICVAISKWHAWSSTSGRQSRCCMRCCYMFCVAAFHIETTYIHIEANSQYCIFQDIGVWEIMGCRIILTVFVVCFTHGVHSHLVSTCNKAYDFYAFSSYSFIVIGRLVIALSALHRLQALQGHSGWHCMACYLMEFYFENWLGPVAS